MKKQKKENNCIPIASFSCPRPKGKNKHVVNKKPKILKNMAKIVRNNQRILRQRQSS